MAIGQESLKPSPECVGIHRDITADVYHKLDAVSSHRLGTLSQSPAHLRYELDHPTPQTDAMKIGSALHTRVLEPEKFDDTYAVAPECDKRTKEGKAVWNEFAEANQDREFLRAGEFETICGMADAIRAHELANTLIEVGGETELTGIWVDEATGLVCKLRADSYSRLVATVFDIKTTEDASRRAFERSIFNYGYHRQGAFYVDGLRALGCVVDHYTIIAVEKSAPHGVAVYRLLEDTLRLGQEENRRLINLYAQCVREKKWPGYPAAVQDIGVPTWAKKQIELELV